MEFDEEIERIKDDLKASIDQERKEWSETYYPTSFRVLGVKVPDQRKVVVSLRKRLKNEDPAKVLRLVKALVNTGIFECQQVAYMLLDKEKKVNSSIGLQDLLDLRKGFDNWISVDTFSAYLSGVAWREGRIDDLTIMEWASSEDRWIRRSALVSTIGLNQKARGGTGDTDRTLMVCDKIKGDRDDMVVKALSWALRELAKTDHEAVENFLSGNEDILAGRVKREVRSKLKTGKKNFREGIG